jgi:hypothetical protein
MVDLVKAFEKDAKAEEQGRWFTIVEGLELLIARARNTKHRAVLERLMRPYRAQIEAGTFPSSEVDRITDEAAAESLWLGFRGDLQIDGKSVVDSQEARLKILRDSRLKDMREAVYAISQSEDSFRKEEIDDAVKN